MTTRTSTPETCAECGMDRDAIAHTRRPAIFRRGGGCYNCNPPAHDRTATPHEPKCHAFIPRSATPSTEPETCIHGYTRSVWYCLTIKHERRPATPSTEGEGERQAAIARVENYVRQRTGRRGLDPDEIHGLDYGTDSEAKLTLTDLRTLLEALRASRGSEEQ